ncbi:MAG: hypothetical protein ACI4U3_09280 [Traorella sp.]
MFENIRTKKSLYVLCMIIAYLVLFNLVTYSLNEYTITSFDGTMSIVSYIVETCLTILLILLDAISKTLNMITLQNIEWLKLTWETFDTTLSIRYLFHALYILFGVMAPMIFYFNVIYTLYCILRTELNMISFNDNTLLIFGYNKDVVGFIDNGEKNICIISKDELSSTDKTYLIKHKVKYICCDVLKDASSLSRLQRKKISKVNKIILWEDNGISNYDICNFLVNNRLIDYKNVDIACCYEDDETIDTNRMLLANYKINENEGLYITMFSPKELISWEMMNSISENLEKKIIENSCHDIHCLIIGFDTIGQSVLNKLVNTTVINADGRIHIDIVDKEMKERMNHYFLSINSQYYNKSDDRKEGCIKISHDDNPSYPDGHLEISFYNYDYNDVDFVGFIKREECCYDYILICAGPSNTIKLIYNLQKLKYDIRNMPLIVAPLDSFNQFKDYSNNQDSFYQRVSFIQTNDFLCKDKIFNNEIEIDAMLYNYNYENVDNKGYLSIINSNVLHLWHNLNDTKRNSSLYQSRYKRVMKTIMWNMKLDENDKDELFNDSFDKGFIKNRKINEIGMIEHRRWCYFEILSGYSYNKDNNKNLKHNACICSWKDLNKNYPDKVIYDFTPAKLICIEERKK